MTELLPVGTRVEHKKTGMRGKVAYHQYGMNVIATDKPFPGTSGLLADGFRAVAKDLIQMPGDK